MGIEIVLLLLLAVAAVGGGLFAIASFVAARVAAGDDGDRKRPTHLYVEDDTDGRIFGADTTDEVRRSAEEDPETEVRSSR